MAWLLPSLVTVGLVRLSTIVFGDSAFAMRLPTLAALSKLPGAWA